MKDEMSWISVLLDIKKTGFTKRWFYFKTYCVMVFSVDNITMFHIINTKNMMLNFKVDR